ncbi:MAG: Gfo/Idh/MocA family oxidoreductase [Planctomycetaceae bacterium]|nr:Gfo/Idh/MocA family oxidoreductase [Planctomycetaceae bacterium]
MKRILVIGGGSIGERHVRCFQNTGRADVSLCELNDDVRQRVAQSYRLRQSFRTLDEALAASHDAAVICTPAHLHVPMAVQLAKRGIALLIEKPLSVSLDGVDELVHVVREAGAPVSMAYVYRAHPALIDMKRALDQRRFGRPVEVVARSGQHFPFYRPAYRQIYYTRHETGGGAIQDALTHLLNAAEWLVGPITRLVADAEHCVLEGVDVEDTVHLIARHGDVLSSFSLNQHQAPNETTLTVICEHGVARLESHRRRWRSCTEPGAEWTVEAEFALERDDLFVRQANAFLDVLDGKAEPACTLTEALQTLCVNLAALQSVKERRWIEISDL